jgi:hypothetical protein
VQHLCIWFCSGIECPGYPPMAAAKRRTPGLAFERPSGEKTQ